MDGEIFSHGHTYWAPHKALNLLGRCLVTWAHPASCVLIWWLLDGFCHVLYWRIACTRFSKREIVSYTPVSLGYFPKWLIFGVPIEPQPPVINLNWKTHVGFTLGSLKFWTLQVGSWTRMDLSPFGSCWPQLHLRLSLSFFSRRPKT